MCNVMPSIGIDAYDDNMYLKWYDLCIKGDN